MPLMNSGADPESTMLATCGGLVVPVVSLGNVSEGGLSVTAGPDVGGGVGFDGVQPASDVLADVVPSLTVILQVGDEYDDAWILYAPLLSDVVVRFPGVRVIVC